MCICFDINAGVKHQFINSIQTQKPNGKKKDKNNNEKLCAKKKKEKPTHTQTHISSLSSSPFGTIEINVSN